MNKVPNVNLCYFAAALQLLRVDLHHQMVPGQVLCQVFKTSFTLPHRTIRSESWRSNLWLLLLSWELPQIKCYKETSKVYSATAASYKLKQRRVWLKSWKSIKLFPNSGTPHGKRTGSSPAYKRYEITRICATSATATGSSNLKKMFARNQTLAQHIYF
jgi:hypothetical protein